MHDSTPSAKVHRFPNAARKLFSDACSTHAWKYGNVRGSYCVARVTCGRELPYYLTLARMLRQQGYQQCKPGGIDEVSRSEFMCGELALARCSSVIEKCNPDVVRWRSEGGWSFRIQCPVLAILHMIILLTGRIRVCQPVPIQTWVQ